MADGDPRRYVVSVAGPSALLVAKLHKIGDRIGSPDRLNDKDAHDIYRILADVDTDVLVASLTTLLADPISAEITDQALAHLRHLFATGPNALGAAMAGRAEEGIGEPTTVALSVSVLASDLVAAIAPGED